MARLYNYSTSTYEPVDDREVAEKVKSGQYTFQSGKKVKIRLPSGKVFEIEPEHAQKAFTLGAGFVTAEEEKQERLKQEYGQGWGNALNAFALGALSGATLTGSNLFLVNQGIISKEALDAYRKYQSEAYIGGDVAGTVGSLLLSGGLAGAGQAGVRGAATAAKVMNVVPSVALAKGASAVGRAVTRRASGNAAQLLAKGAGEGIGKTRNAIVLGALAEGAVDAAGYATADHITEYYLGNPDKNAETFLGNFGLSAALGGTLSAAIPGIRHLVKPMSAEKSMDVLRYATGRFVDTSKARVEVAQRLKEQEGITLEEAMGRVEASVDKALWREAVDEDVISYNDILTEIDDAIQSKLNFIDRLSAERDLDLDDIGPVLTEAKQRVDELRKKKADLDDVSGLEDAVKKERTETLDLRQQYAEELEALQNEIENLSAAKIEAQGTLNAVKKQRDKIVEEGHTSLTHEMERKRDTAVGAVERIYTMVEEGKALARGAHRNSVLVQAIESTTDEGTRGVDLIEDFYTQLADMRLQMENARSRPGIDASEVTTVVGVLDAIENEINEVLAKVGKFEVSKAPKEATLFQQITARREGKSVEDLAREGQQADFRQVIKSKAVDSPELDLQIKREMFIALDENRKVLGDIIFNHARDGKIAWNTTSLLKDAWQGFKVLQSHKSFGKAGEQIAQVTEAFSGLLEADRQFSSFFMAPKRFEREGRRYTDRDKLERFFGNPDKSFEKNEGLRRYLEAANNLISVSDNVGLYAKADNVVADVVDVQAVAAEAAQRYSDELSNRISHVTNDVLAKTGDEGLANEIRAKLENVIARRSEQASENYLNGEMTQQLHEQVAREVEDVVRDTLQANQRVDPWDEALDYADSITDLRARYSLKERSFPEEMPANDATLVSLTAAGRHSDNGSLAAKMRGTYEQLSESLGELENSIITQQVDDALNAAKSARDIFLETAEDLHAVVNWSTKDIWTDQGKALVRYLDETIDYLNKNSDVLAKGSDVIPVNSLSVRAFQAFESMAVPTARIQEVSAPETLAGQLARATRETNESIDGIRNILGDAESLRQIKGGRQVKPAGHPVHQSIEALQELSLREKNARAVLEEQVSKHKGAKTRQRLKKGAKAEELAKRRQVEGEANAALQLERNRRADELAETERELADVEATASVYGADAQGLKRTVQHYQNLERQSISELKDAAYGLEKPSAYRPRLPGDEAGVIGDLQASGTTSLPGLAMYQVGGWQGAALGSIGFSSVIKALRAGADPQRRYLGYLAAYDTMVKYQHNRKRIVSDFLSGKLKKATVDRKASSLALMLGSLMKYGEFEGLFEASSGDDFTDATARLHTINSNPNLKLKILEDSVAPMMASMPQHAAAVQKQMATMLEYLGEQCPREPQTGMFALSRRSTWRPSDSQVFSFQTGCVEPLENQLETLQNGLAQRTITPRQVQTWQVCTPSFYADCAEDMYSGFAELKEPAPYDVRTVAAVFLGSHVEVTRQTPFVQGMQGMFNQQIQPIGDAASATRGRSEAALTPTQERQQRTV